MKKSNDIKVPFAKFGSGEKTLVIIPGMSMTRVSDSVEGVAKQYAVFADGYNCYVLDRGEKLSSIEDMADEAYSAMLYLGIEKPYIIGASQGGMVAMCIASRHPGYPAKICVSSTSARENDLYAGVCAEWRRLSESGDKELLYKAMAEKMFCEKTISSLPADAARTATGNVGEEDLARFIKIIDANRGFDIRSRLSHICCPMIVFGSKNDSVFGGEESETIAKKTGARLVMTEKFGHALYDEDQSFAKTVYDFFENE